MLFQTENFFRKEHRKIFFSRLFRKIFLEDWLMKLVALIITLALWFGVTPSTRRLQNIPLNIRVSNNIEVTNLPVTKVDIVVTGDKRKIDALNSRDLVVSLDLTDVQPEIDRVIAPGINDLVISLDWTGVQAGDRTVQIMPGNVRVELPSGVKLEEVQPNKIPVKLETVEEREIPVTVEIKEGSVAEGFEVYGEPIVLPPKVRVRGPSSFIKKLNSISTEKINIDGRRTDFTAQQVSLNVDQKATLLDTVVDVAFRIGEKRIERLFLVSVQTKEGVKKVKVILYGARSLLEGVTSENLRVEFVKTESGDSKPRVILPAELDGKVEIREPKNNPQ
ncbi:MAG: CdaR family protein [Pyrinomonadaceae bacterium]